MGNPSQNRFPWTYEEDCIVKMLSKKGCNDYEIKDYLKSKGYTRTAIGIQKHIIETGIERKIRRRKDYEVARESDLSINKKVEEYFMRNVQYKDMGQK